MAMQFADHTLLYTVSLLASVDSPLTLPLFHSMSGSCIKVFNMLCIQNKHLQQQKVFYPLKGSLCSLISISVTSQLLRSILSLPIQSCLASAFTAFLCLPLHEPYYE